MLKRIRSKFQCLKGEGQNSNVWNDKMRIPMFGRIKSEFKCLERERKNPNA